MCLICQQTRRVVTALDWRRRIEWVDIHQRSEVERHLPDADFSDLMGQIHVLSDAATLDRGYFGTRRLLKELPLAYPVWLLLHLPGMTWLGQRIYAFIARNRYAINRAFGVAICEDESCRVEV
jgi:predicted DCC family thiol-disulfide oxidoreductase YuxK